MRRQLPVYSPVSLRAVAAAAGLASGTDDARTALADTLRREYGASAILLTDSGTTALTLALRAAVNDHAGSPVALPGYGCFDLATAAEGAGVRAILYDLVPETLQPDWDSLEQALRGGARAVIVVHLYGMPVDMQRVRELAAVTGAVVIEDAAQAVGTAIAGRPAGSHGAVGVLSFGRGKGRTGGAGGALLVNDAAVGRMLDGLDLTLRSAGGAGRMTLALLAQWTLGRPWLYWIPASIPWLQLGETIHREPRPPGALGVATARAILATREASCREVWTRRRNAATWRAMLAGTSHVRPVLSLLSDEETGFLRLPVLTSERGATILATRAARLAGAWPGYPVGLDSLPRFRQSVIARDMPLVGAGCLARSLFTLPTHHWLTERDRAAVRRALEAGL